MLLTVFVSVKGLVNYTVSTSFKKFFFLSFFPSESMVLIQLLTSMILSYNVAISFEILSDLLWGDFNHYSDLKFSFILLKYSQTALLPLAMNFLLVKVIAF